MYILTYTETENSNSVNLFDTETGIRYNLCYLKDVSGDNYYDTGPKVHINSAHTTYDETSVGLTYYDQEALTFWEELSLLLPESQKQLVDRYLEDAYQALRKLNDIEKTEPLPF